jgi:hypothetical protein
MEVMVTMVTEAMEVTVTVMAATTVIMAMDIGTTGTMVTGVATDMATVGGGAGVGMVMGLEPAGPGRHMAIGGFATESRIVKRPQDELLGPFLSENAALRD